MEFKEVCGYKVSKCGLIIGRRGKPLTPVDNGSGYLICKVFINGKWTSKSVHRFVAEAWIDNPDNLPEINHIDCNRTNNSIDNLEWCTHSFNVLYSYITEGRSAAGESNARCKTTESEVRQICEMLVMGVSSAKIRDEGFDYDLVRAIKSKKNWTHVSNEYQW
jgi:hypothetical protein